MKRGRIDSGIYLKPEKTAQGDVGRPVTDTCGLPLGIFLKKMIPNRQNPQNFSGTQGPVVPQVWEVFSERNNGMRPSRTAQIDASYNLKPCEPLPSIWKVGMKWMFKPKPVRPK